MYVKLFEDLLDSTIWMEKDHIVRVWLALLLMADSKGFVEIPIPALASRARVGLDECSEAIARLEAPDQFSRTSAEEGRRILRITNEKTLWKIVNFEYYRAMKSAEQKRQYQRRYMQDYRKRRKEEDSHCEENEQKSSQCESKEHGLAQAEAEAEAEGKKTTSSRGEDKVRIDAVMMFWETNGLSPKVTAMSKARRSAILARGREHGWDRVMEALENRRDSNFLCNIFNDGRGAPIDWVFGPKNFVKVLDNYSNKKGGKSGGFSEYDGKL